MNIGSLRHKVYVFQPVDNMTDRGDNEIEYPETSTEWYWGAIEPLQGRELLFALQLRADLTHKITLRFARDITFRTQLRWYDGVEWIKFNCGPPVNNEMRNRELSVYASSIH
jgi:head-tail adaptor